MTKPAKVPAIGKARPHNRPPNRWPTGEDGLTDRQRLFVAEVQVDWNYTQAALRAGYAAASARDTAHDLMKDPKIKAAIGDTVKSRIAEAGVNRGWVLTNLVDVHAKASKVDTLGGMDRRLKALELIGRHRDVDAFRGTGGGPTEPMAPTRGWDLDRLDDQELDTFERLLAKIQVGYDEQSDAGNGARGEGKADAGPGAASDDAEPGNDQSEV